MQQEFKLKLLLDGYIREIKMTKTYIPGEIISLCLSFYTAGITYFASTDDFGPKELQLIKNILCSAKGFEMLLQCPKLLSNVNRDYKIPLLTIKNRITSKPFIKITLKNWKYFVGYEEKAKCRIKDTIGIYMYNNKAKHHRMTGFIDYGKDYQDNPSIAMNFDVENINETDINIINIKFQWKEDVGYIVNVNYNSQVFSEENSQSAEIKHFSSLFTNSYYQVKECFVGKNEYAYGHCLRSWYQSCYPTKITITPII
eukprot:130216_1